MSFCIHEYAQAINLANGYEYKMCIHCGIPHGSTNILKASAKTDLRDYNESIYKGNEMATKYRRTWAQKCRNFEREIGWWWDRNREGVYAGFMVGSFSVLIAFYLVWWL